MIRILIVAEIRLYREGLAESLARRDEIRVVATAESAAAALQLAADLAPHVLVMDRAMRHSLPAVRELCERHPGMAAIALGVQDKEEDVLACAEAGVCGYVSRDASIDELVSAIEHAARGEAVCSPRIAGALFRQVAAQRHQGVASAARSGLTSREAEILALLREHLSNKAIASRLGIEVSTVKNHVHHLLEKLRVHRRSEAAAHLATRDPWRSAPPEGHRIRLD